MDPKISIITITYNSEKTLQRTIDSIANQQYPALEYIIVDGQSNDSTLDIVKKNSDKIATWVSEPDDGISDAFNKGIRLATGDLIGLINSDDQLEPGALQKLAQSFRDDVDVYCGNLIQWNEKSGQKTVAVPSIQYTVRGKNRICHPSTFITKAAYEKYGLYDVSCKYAMDIDLLMRYYQLGANFLHVNETLATFTMGGISFSEFTEERLQELIKIYKKNGATKKDICLYVAKRKIKNMLIKMFGRDKMSKLSEKRLNQIED